MEVTMKVSELIRADGTWDVIKMQGLFTADDISRICAFRPNLAARDRYIWAYSRNGSYSVKSGNWLISKPKPGEVIMPHVDQENVALKGKVWQVKTVPKMRLFLWRAMSGALAVAECLNVHGVQMPLVCTICKQCAETINHVLFHCVPAKAAWSNSNVSLRSAGFSSYLGENFRYLFGLMEDPRLDEKLWLVIPWLVLGVWKHRNDLMYGEKQGDINVLISLAFEESEMWRHQQEAMVQERRLPCMMPREVGLRWSKPPLGTVKCNMSSSWRSSNDMCGGGWILRDHGGDVKYHSRNAFTSLSCRLAAEFRCIIWDLQSLKILHIEACEIWTESAAAVTAIYDSEKWPRFQVYLNQIHHLLTEVQGFRFVASPPQVNFVARDIVQSVTRDGRFRSYLSIGGPAWLKSRVREESQGSSRV